MGANTPLTLGERKKIEALLRTGISCSAISRKIERGKNTVVSEVKRCGGRLTYTAKEAQKRYEQTRNERYEKLRQINLGQRSSVTTMTERIDCLEMQVEILSETLKELINAKNHKL